MIMLTLAQKLALASTVCDDLINYELLKVVGNGDIDFDYHIESFTPPTPMISPCPNCPEGAEGEGYELEFTMELFGLDVDNDMLPAWAYEEIQQAIYEAEFA